MYIRNETSFFGSIFVFSQQPKFLLHFTSLRVTADCLICFEKKKPRDLDPRK